MIYYSLTFLFYIVTGHFVPYAGNSDRVECLTLSCIARSAQRLIEVNVFFKVKYIYIYE